MKKRYELQFYSRTKRWRRSAADEGIRLLKSKIEYASDPENMRIWLIEYRVVQKLGRKVIEVVYPKGSK